jgi:hypothetical protein
MSDVVLELCSSASTYCYLSKLGMLVLVLCAAMVTSAESARDLLVAARVGSTSICYML